MLWNKNMKKKTKSEKEEEQQKKKQRRRLTSSIIMKFYVYCSLTLFFRNRIIDRRSGIESNSTYILILYSYMQYIFMYKYIYNTQSLKRIKAAQTLFNLVFVVLIRSHWLALYSYLISVPVFDISKKFFDDCQDVYSRKK